MVITIVVIIVDVDADADADMDDGSATLALISVLVCCAPILDFEPPGALSSLIESQASLFWSCSPSCLSFCQRDLVLKGSTDFAYQLGFLEPGRLR